LAAQTWLALQAIDVPPTTRNFELWFTYLGGGNAELTLCMEELLQHGHRPVAEVLELIHAESIADQGEAHFEPSKMVLK